MNDEDLFEALYHFSSHVHFHDDQDMLVVDEIEKGMNVDSHVLFFKTNDDSYAPLCTPQQLEERRAKGLCYNCDRNYSKGHKCNEKKLFYIDCEEEEEEDEEVEQILNIEETAPTISCHAFVGISTPQTLQIEEY